MKKKRPVERLTHSPFHPIRIDISGMSEEGRYTLKKAFREKGLIN